MISIVFVDVHFVIATLLSSEKKEENIIINRFAKDLNIFL